MLACKLTVSLAIALFKLNDFGGLRGWQKAAEHG